MTILNGGHSLSQDFVVVGISVQEFQDLHQTLDVPETKKKNSSGFVSATLPGIFGSQRVLPEERRPSRKHAHVT